MNDCTIYQFPPIKEAVEQDIEMQSGKVGQEAAELQEAARWYWITEGREGKEHLLEEAWDVRHALEGIFRRFEPAEIEAARARVEAKNRERGYYDQDPS